LPRKKESPQVEAEIEDQEELEAVLESLTCFRPTYEKIEEYSQELIRLTAILPAEILNYIWYTIIPSKLEVEEIEEEEEEEE